MKYPWLKRLFSDTGLHLNAIRFLAVPMPQRKRVGRASVACTGRYVGRNGAVALAQACRIDGPSPRPRAHAAHSMRIVRQFRIGGIIALWFHNDGWAEQMSTNGVRAAIYLRVSRDDQTTENQRLVLAKVAEHRGWVIVQTYEDGISGAKGRDQRPAFDTDAQGRGTATVRCPDGLVNRPAWTQRSPRRQCPGRTGCCRRRPLLDQQAIDSTTPMGRAMIQMASVFGEQERQIIRSRVMAGLDRVRQQGKKLGRPKVSPKIEDAIRRHLSAGHGILKVAADGRRRKRNCAAGEAGDGREVGGYSVPCHSTAAFGQVYFVDGGWGRVAPPVASGHT